MTAKLIIENHRKNMEKTIDVFRGELRSLRTGRASPGLVENLPVEYYGSPTPLKQLATIAAPEPASIIIKPFDPACLKDIEKAIKNSELSLAPILDGKMIRLNLPALSQERRQQIAHQVKQLGEKSKVGLRNIRRDANKQLDDEEKDKTITEDQRDRSKKDIDDLTKKFSDSIDEIVKSKSEEIMTS